jgi:hypothetical protein
MAAALGSGCGGESGAMPEPAPISAVSSTDEPPNAEDALQTELVVYDASGSRLTPAAFDEQRSNGAGEPALNDALVRPSTLEVVQERPLYDDGGRIVFDRSSGDEALALAWSSSEGFSNLIVEVPPGDRLLLNELVATQLIRDLDETVRAARDAGVTIDVAWDERRSSVIDAYGRAKGLADETEKAAAMDEVTDVAVHLLTQPVRAHGDDEHRRTRVVGITVDRVDLAVDWQAAKELVRGSDEAWARIVFDLDASPFEYRDTVDAAHAAGFHVLGSVTDSYYMAELSPSEHAERWRRYVDELGPLIDGWEIGNEVNGSWLGPDVAEKIRFAARYVRDHTSARTMLTLYWQLGEDAPAYSLFNWMTAELDPELLSLVDDIGLSVWPQAHPLGASFDRVLREVRRRIGDRRLVISELGYGTSGLDELWWWADPTETEVGRLEVAGTYQRLVLDRPWVDGGVYWWDYVTQAPPQSRLWETLRDATLPP